MTTTTTPNHSKHLPLLSFLFALLLQTVVVVSYFNGVDNRSMVNQSGIERNEGRLDRLEVAVQKQEVMLARMSEHLGAIRQVVEAMNERALNRD